MAQQMKSKSQKMRRFNRWDTPWLNPMLIGGCGIIFAILAMGMAGQIFWDTDLAYTGAAPLNLPPYGFEGLRGSCVSPPVTFSGFLSVKEGTASISIRV